MTLRLYMDHHVPRAITEGLRRRGIDILTAHEDNAAECADEVILLRATELVRVIFTQDHDFLALAHQWLTNGRTFAGVIYAHQLRITIGQAVRELFRICSVLDPRDMQDRIEFLSGR